IDKTPTTKVLDFNALPTSNAIVRLVSFYFYSAEDGVVFRHTTRNRYRLHGQREFTPPWAYRVGWNVDEGQGPSHYGCCPWQQQPVHVCGDVPHRLSSLM
ncbi:hypothetical protein, partial [Bifidobacterium longum]|uniref:hypothetical protein n=1 Tax=Bifidobacterium longum TaxID=216816 RepID=UPI00249E4362